VVFADKCTGLTLVEEASGTTLLAARHVNGDFVISQSPDSLFRACSKQLAALLNPGVHGSRCGPPGGGSPPPASGCGASVTATLRRDKKRQRYTLYSTGCELCDVTMGKFSCSGHSDARKLDRQQLAIIRHKTGHVTPTVTAKILVTDIPPVDEHNQRVVWCARSQYLDTPTKVQVPFSSPSVRNSSCIFFVVAHSHFFPLVCRVCANGQTSPPPLPSPPFVDPTRLTTGLAVS